MPASRPNLWQAPGGAPAHAAMGAPGSAPATMGAGVPPAAGPMHVSGLHPDTMRHVAAHLHGLAQAMEGKPHVLPPSPAGTMLHRGTLSAISHATSNMGGMGAQPTGPTINRVG